MVTIKEHIASINDDLLYNGLLTELKKTFPDAYLDEDQLGLSKFIALKTEKDAALILYVRESSVSMEAFSSDANTIREKEIENSHNSLLAKAIGDVYMLSSSRPKISEETVRELSTNHANEVIISLFDHFKEPSDYDLNYNEKYLGYNHTDQYKWLLKELNDTLEYKPHLNRLMDSFCHALDSTVKIDENPGAHITTSCGELETEFGYTRADIIDHCDKVSTDILRVLKNYPHYTESEKQLLLKVEERTIASFLFLDDKPVRTIKTDMASFLNKYNVTNVNSQEVITPSSKQQDSSASMTR